VDRTFRLLFLVGIPLVILLVAGAGDIIFLISGPGYEGAIVPMMTISPLVLVIGLEQILIIQILMPLKEDRQILVNSAVGALVAIMVNLLLVSRLKAEGSAIVWLCAEFAVFLCALIAVLKKDLIRFPWTALLKDILLYLPLAGLLVAFRLYPSMNVFVRLLGECAVTGLYFLAVSCLVVRNPEVLSIVSSLTHRADS